jgi:hypothetical protein
MLVQLKGNTDPRERFHLSTGIAKSLIALGNVEAYIAPAKPIQPTNWAAMQGGLQGAYPPVIRVSCSNCSRNETSQSDKGTAHAPNDGPFFSFTHCKGREEVPRDVVGAYLTLWAKWRNEFQAKQVAREQKEKRRVTFAGR